MDNAYFTAAGWIDTAPPALDVQPTTSLADAVHAMLEEHRKVICVVDHARALIGIVDRADLLRAAGTAPADLGVPCAANSADG